MIKLIMSAALAGGTETQLVAEDKEVEKVFLRRVPGVCRTQGTVASERQERFRIRTEN
jgi:hypothetical protein